jgi:hypothetical protein
MGFSRDTFYRYQSAMESGGIDALIDANRRKPNPKNRVEEATEMAVAAFAIEQPAFGQVRVSSSSKPGGSQRKSLRGAQDQSTSHNALPCLVQSERADVAIIHCDQCLSHARCALHGCVEESVQRPGLLSDLILPIKVD